FGCSDGDDGHTHDHDAGPDAGHDAGQGPHRGMVACKGDEDPHTPGTKKAGSAGKFSIEIVSADPAAHDVSRRNQLTVKVLDAADMPVTDATVEVEVWTPSHGGHPADTQPNVQGGAQAGEYRIGDISYVHSGPWELRFTITKGSDTDTLALVVCVGGDPPDAGTPDAGPDATAPDAAAPDAGPDAAAPDAGPDAAAPDATAPDAGDAGPAPPDAGDGGAMQPDAGSPDAADAATPQG
ncbi:MAG: FixH family protein, partial [Proteobacteria bacterium]|nr:FixH family protein [Pseudomonadota bacterium]